MPYGGKDDGESKDLFARDSLANKGILRLALVSLELTQNDKVGLHVSVVKQ